MQVFLDSNIYLSVKGKLTENADFQFLFETIKTKKISMAIFLKKRVSLVLFHQNPFNARYYRQFRGKLCLKQQGEKVNNNKY